MMANIRNRFSSSSRRRALFLRCSLLSVLVVAFCFGNVIWMSIIRHSDDQDLNTNSHPSEREKIAQMLAYLESNEHINRTACRLFYEFGGGINPNHNITYKDGQKSLCVDPGLAPKVNDCLVYSFGIDNEWSFDDEISKLGCHVYSFDPSMETDNFNRSSLVHFYQMGLWDKDGVILLDKLRPNATWKVLSLSSFYRLLRPFHGDKIIDYVKIDVEGDEWTILPQILRSGILKRVKQLAMEIHFWRNETADKIQDRIEILKSLKTPQHGFVPFDYKVNLGSKGVIGAKDSFSCAEIAYYNSKFRL